MAEVLVRTMILACPPEHAFDVFTDKIDLWWPRGHRKYPKGSLRLELVDGGDLVDRAPDGSEWTMARVAALDPPSLLSLDWYPGSPAAPTAVEVRFAPQGEGTEITVTHRALTLEARSVWPRRVSNFTQGWEAVLPALRTFIEEEH